MTNNPNIYPRDNDIIPYSPRGRYGFTGNERIPLRVSIDGLSPATCPSSMTQGTAKDVTINATGGTAPFTYKFYVDGTVVKNSGPISNISYTFNKTFNETGSSSGTSHEYKAEVTDSCNTGNQVKTDICNVLITTTSGGTSYNCVSGACQGPYTTGTYPDLASCQTACAADNYCCSNNVCTQGCGTLPAGCNNTCGGNGGTESNCKDPMNLGCTSGIPNTYLGAGILLLVLLLKK